MDIKKLKVGVLAGGVSEEREISLRSGKQVFSALNKENISACFIDLKSSDSEEIKLTLLESKIDIAFIALHGFFGEDGQIQTILEEISLAYTGSGPEASRLSMDKVASKEKFRSLGIKTPDYQVFSYRDIQKRKISYPAVVKPNFSGSSFGISIVKKPTLLAKALEVAFSFNDQVIVEDFIQGRELTVGILKDKPLAVVEIIPKKGFFDFNNKYNKGNSNFIVPAKLDSKLYNLVQNRALAAHQALGCRDFSRVDIRLSDRSPYVLEVNSIPGLTSESLLPLSALACGINFQKLAILLLESAYLRQKKAIKLG